MKSENELPRIDPVAELAKHVPTRVGSVHTFGGHSEVYSGYQPAVVRHESGDRWTVGLCVKWTCGKVQKAICCVSGGRADVAAVLADLFPETAAWHVAGEESRRRYKAESDAREVEQAERARRYALALCADLSAAMAKSGCACRWLAESRTDASNGYGDVDGVAVYCDSQEGADRIAAWIAKWEQRRYELAGGTYSADYLGAQRRYGVSPMAAPPGAPFAAFASFRYYSRGD